jgi:hypothetical protein
MHAEKMFFKDFLIEFVILKKKLNILIKKGILNISVFQLKEIKI